MMPALFIGFGAMLLASSLLVILHKNPVTSALFLVLAFCSLAGIYLVLHAELIGMVQIIVYAGAIMVLFLFVIMYLNLRHDPDAGLRVTVRRALGWVTGAVLLAEIVLLVAMVGAIVISKGRGGRAVDPIDPRAALRKLLRPGDQATPGGDAAP